MIGDQHRLHGLRPRARRGLPPDSGGRGADDARGRLRRAHELAATCWASRCSGRSRPSTTTTRSTPRGRSTATARASCSARARWWSCSRSCESARARGAPILAEIAGYGVEPQRLPHDRPAARRRRPVIAMKTALGEAGLATDEVDYVVAHGTGTPAATSPRRWRSRRVFGDDAGRLAVTSPKSMTGHATAGAGGMNLLAAIMAMRDGVVSPTINLDNPDPELDLDYVPNKAQRDATCAPRWSTPSPSAARTPPCWCAAPTSPEWLHEPLDDARPASLASRPAHRPRRIRNVPNTLAIFDSHFPRFPVLPGVLILGSLGELAGVLLEERDRQALAPGGRRPRRLPALRSARATRWSSPSSSRTARTSRRP